MKRILYDVSKWHCFLHREARGMDQVEDSDTALDRFQDELFDRLYAGTEDCDLLPEEEQEASLRDWAMKVHAAAEELPAFARLGGEVRGDALAAAAAVESLMESLTPKDPQEGVRKHLAQACSRASQAVEGLRDTLEGLSGVGFGSGTESSRRPLDQTPIRALAARLRTDKRLQELAILAGRFKRIAAQKRRQKVRHGADEISDVCQGSDLGRLLPSEMLRLVHPALKLAFLRSLAERECLQYELTGSAVLGKGPIVACLDKSGSMDGPRDLWAVAVAMALQDQASHEGRPFMLLGFDGAVKYEAKVMPGQTLPEAGLFVECGGGTDIAHALERALSLIRSDGQLRKSDIVLITDGQSDPELAPDLRKRAKELNVSILGFGIGVGPETLEPWCDEARAIWNLQGLDDRAAEAMFGG